MRTVHFIMLTCMVIMFVSCDRNPAQVSTLPEPSQTSSATLTSTATQISPAKTATPTLAESADAVASPEPTQLPTPIQQTPVPEPINQTGPWMMLSPDVFYSGAGRTIGPVFSNADGSGWEPANLPHDPHSPPDELDWWFAKVSPKGPYVAFEDYLSEYHPMCSQDSTKVFQWPSKLYILKLPENKVVRQVSLFGQKASEQIHKEECEFVKQGRYDTPPVLGVVQNVSSLSWSPDGRYLVLPAATEGYGADLYLYDTLTDSLRRLTSRQNNPDILGWSPDGQTIIYRAITKMELFHLQFMESSGLYALSVSGSDRMLFEPDGLPNGLEWLSPSTFLISDGPCDFSGGSGFCTTHLRLVDLSTRMNEVIYSNSQTLIKYLTDPIHHLLLIPRPPSDMPGLSGVVATPDQYRPDLAFVTGIYQYDFKTRSLQLVLAEDMPNVHWDSKAQAFHAYDWDQTPPYTTHTTFIRYIPGQGFDIEKVDNQPDFSPDGQWAVEKVGEDWFILNAQDQPIQKLHGYSGSWSPDSSTYVELIANEKLAEPLVMVYLRKDNWRPTLARQIFYGQMWSNRWITP